MRYQRCKYFDEGYCYNMGLRNGLNTLGCVGYDRCEVYQIEQKLPLSENISRIDIIGQNGNTGESYMSSPVECEECGGILQFEGDQWYCPNDDCLSVTGEKVVAHEPGMTFLPDEDKPSPGKVILLEDGPNYRPTIGAEKLASDHWDYMEESYRLAMPYDSMEWGVDELLDFLKHNYISAMVHGHKHAQEGD